MSPVNEIVKLSREGRQQEWPIHCHFYYLKDQSYDQFRLFYINI